MPHVVFNSSSRKAKLGPPISHNLHNDTGEDSNKSAITQNQLEEKLIRSYSSIDQPFECSIAYLCSPQKRQYDFGSEAEQ